MIFSTLFAATLSAAAPLAAPAMPVAAASSAVVITPATSVRVVGPATRVCVRTDRAGSRFDRKMCRSYARWLADGTDPLAAPSAR